jgi:hypothetical protein
LNDEAAAGSIVALLQQFFWAQGGRTLVHREGPALQTGSAKRAAGWSDAEGERRKAGIPVSSEEGQTDFLKCKPAILG